MKTGTILKGSLFTSLIFTIIGAYMKIAHLQGAQTVMVIGMIATLVFIITAIYEVRTSANINNAEKNMWTLGFILTSSIAGLVYIFIGRKKITSHK